MWHDIFQSYADAISVATMQRPTDQRARIQYEDVLPDLEPSRGRPILTRIIGHIGQRFTGWIRQSRRPVVAGCG